MKLSRLHPRLQPTAAAFGAGLPGGSKLLVVDVGGSTIDMSMVLVEGGEGELREVKVTQTKTKRGRKKKSVEINL